MPAVAPALHEAHAAEGLRGAVADLVLAVSGHAQLGIAVADPLHLLHGRVIVYEIKLAEEGSDELAVRIDLRHRPGLEIHLGSRRPILQIHVLHEAAVIHLQIPAGLDVAQRIHCARVAAVDGEALLIAVVQVVELHVHGQMHAVFPGLQRVVTGVDGLLHGVGLVEELRCLAEEAQLRIHPEALAAEAPGPVLHKALERLLRLHRLRDPEHALRFIASERADQATAVLGDDRPPVSVQLQYLISNILRFQHPFRLIECDVVVHILPPECLSFQKWLRPSPEPVVIPLV